MAAPALLDVIVVVVTLFVTFVASVGALIFVRRYLQRMAERTATKVDDYAIKLIGGPLVVFILAFGVLSALQYWNVRFPDTLPDWLTLHFGDFTTAVLIIIATSIVGFLVNSVVSRQLQKAVAGDVGKESAFRLINRILLLFIYLVGALGALAALFPGLLASLTALVVGAGFLGIVLGLGAQRVIGNFISGINVNLTHPIRLGDAVVIKGEYGTVEDITLRHTVIRTWDNRRMIIPNSVLDDEVIINYTVADEKKLFPIVMYVPYDTDIEKAAAILVEETKKHPDVLPELAPIFQVLDFAEGAITLRILFLAKNQPTAFNTGVALRRAYKRRFDEAGIRLSCPTRYITGFPSDTGLESVGK